MELNQPFDGPIRDPREPGGVGDYFVFLSIPGFASSLFSPDLYGPHDSPYDHFFYPMGYRQLFVLEKTAMLVAENPGPDSDEGAAKLRVIEGEIPAESPDEHTKWAVLDVAQQEGRFRLTLAEAIAEAREICATPERVVMLCRTIDDVMWH
jgi:hypothetical protein